MWYRSAVLSLTGLMLYGCLGRSSLAAPGEVADGDLTPPDWLTYDGSHDGPEQRLTTNTDLNHCTTATAIDATHALLVYCENYSTTRAVVGTVAGSSLSLSPAVDLWPAYIGRDFNLLTLDPGRVLVIYDYGNPPNDARAMVLTVDATGVTDVGPEASLAPVDAGYTRAALLSAAQAIVVYAQTATTRVAAAHVLDLTTSPVGVSPAFTFFSDTETWDLGLDTLDSNHALVAARHSGTSTTRLTVLTTSGNQVVSASTPVELAPTNDVNELAVLRLSESLALVLYRDGWFSGTPTSATALVAHIDGTGITLGSATRVGPARGNDFAIDLVTPGRALVVANDQDRAGVMTVEPVSLSGFAIEPGTPIVVSGSRAAGEGAITRLNPTQAVVLYESGDSVYARLLSLD